MKPSTSNSPDRAKAGGLPSCKRIGLIKEDHRRQEAAATARTCCRTHTPKEKDMITDGNYKRKLMYKLSTSSGIILFEDKVQAKSMEKLLNSIKPGSAALNRWSWETYIER